jgi:hypothetical protein
MTTINIPLVILQMSFAHQLEAIGFSPSAYLRQARTRARQHGYEEPVDFATDGKHKLQITLPTKTIKFGLVGYKDFLIYSFLEKHGKVPKGTAKQKQTNYHKRQKRGDKYSPATLSRNIQW